MEDVILQAQLDNLRSDGCLVHAIMPAKSGDMVILYSPIGHFSLHARIVYPSGCATKRHLNDLSLHVSPVAGTPLKTWYLHYIRILGDKMNRGYGSIMMKQLLTLAEQEDVVCIEGRLQQAEHREHQERLRHFYAKFGFLVDEANRLRWLNPKLANVPAYPCGNAKPLLRIFHKRTR